MTVVRTNFKRFVFFIILYLNPLVANIMVTGVLHGR